MRKKLNNIKFWVLVEWDKGIWRRGGCLFSNEGCRSFLF